MAQTTLVVVNRALWLMISCPILLILMILMLVLIRGGGVLPYIGMCRPVSFFSRFGLKTGINFEHFGLELGVVSGETFTKAYKLIFLSSNRGELLVRLKDK